jgi:hypothetical protein
LIVIDRDIPLVEQIEFLANELAQRRDQADSQSLSAGEQPSSN